MNLSIKSELLTIQHADPENILRPPDVVAWARQNTDSALYKAIEWNDRKAADAHRLWQVRQLITLHIVTVEHQPMVVSLSIDRSNGGGYRQISDVTERPDLREIMLADALAELERVRIKYERVKELETIWLETERLRAASPARTRRKREAVTA